MDNNKINEIKNFLKENVKIEENKNIETKSIICFVCSSEFPSIESWKDHIINSHIEEEEFLLCPECEIPCRDLKSHYKVHHKDINMPVFELQKVKKMYDWTQKYSRMKKKKPKWKEGFYESIKMGKKIHFRSSWERDTMICLEKCQEVNEYYGDNYLCIPYYLQGKLYRYWPDFTIKMDNGDTYIIEIKPFNQTELDINKKKWKAAVEYCNKRQWVFQVWTQKHIKKIKTRASRNSLLLREHIIPNDNNTSKEIPLN